MTSRDRKRPSLEEAIQAPDLHGIDEAPVALERLDDDFLCERSLIDQAGLRGARASGVGFDACVIRRTALEASILSRLRMTDVALEKSNCNNARWERAHLRRVWFSGCRLTGFSLAEADCREAVFKDCKADFLRMDRGDMRNVRFEDCVLTDAEFGEANLRNAVFKNCDLTNANFVQAKFSAVDVRGSKLDRIKIEPNQLRGLIIDPLQALVLISLLGTTVA